LFACVDDNNSRVRAISDSDINNKGTGDKDPIVVASRSSARGSLTTSGSSNSLNKLDENTKPGSSDDILNSYNKGKNGAVTSRGREGRSSHRTSFSFTDRPFFASIGVKSNSGNLSSSSSDAVSSGNTSQPATKNGSGTSSSSSPSSQQQQQQQQPHSKGSHFSISSFFGGGKHHSPTNSNSSSNGNISGSNNDHRSGGGSGIHVPFRRASAGPSSTTVNNKSTMPTSFPPENRPQSMKMDNNNNSNNRKMNSDGFAIKPITVTNLAESKVPIPSSSTLPTSSAASSDAIKENEYDTVFNLMDNYSALLCCAFLHVDLIPSLLILITEGSKEVVEKGRKLLINFLKMLSNVLPDSTCAQLLTSPALIELAASLGPKRSILRTFRASMLLSDIANTFSLMPIQNNPLASPETSSGVTSSSPLSQTGPLSNPSVRSRTGSAAASRSGSGKFFLHCFIFIDFNFFLVCFFLFFFFSDVSYLFCLSL
jgi:hypothetical protein